MDSFLLVDNVAFECARPGFAACGLLHIYCINGWTRPRLVSGDVDYQ